MRLIGYIPEDQAHRFSDYLLTLGIAMHIEESERGWALWVEHDDHVDRAKAELAAFQKAPDTPRYGAQRQASRIRVEQESRQRRLRSRHIDVRTSWAMAGERTRPVTMALVILSIVITGVVWLGRGSEEINYALKAMSITSWDHHWPQMPEILSGQVWRLFTPMFVHFDVLHILFNMLWLWNLGGIIELRRGWLKLLLLVLASAMLSNLAQYAWSGTPNFGGMSGVVYALFGFAWMKGRFQPNEGIILHPNTVFIMLAWLVFAAILIPGIANAAHLAGLVVGAAAGLGGYLTRRRV